MRRALLGVAVLGLLLARASTVDAQWSMDGLLPAYGGRIGLRVEPMTPELREHMKAPADRGVLVVRVEDDRPAARAGIRVGDVVTGADDAAITRPFDLVQAAARPEEAESLALELYRDGRPRSVSLTPEGPAQPWMTPESWQPWLEQHMRRGSEEVRRKLEEFERRQADTAPEEEQQT